MSENHKICSRCVMDTSDPNIEFDSEGVCNHCYKYDSRALLLKAKGLGEDRLAERFAIVKEKGKNKEYDCILGLSGGIDSSYVAVKIKDYGLRPLVVHVDAGWNSELAVSNIEQLVKYCGYELYTHVMDWEEIRDLQVAYLKSGVANQDVVQDHAFFSSIYHFAVKNRISTIISGENIATEGVFPAAWQHEAMDATSIHGIHKIFGTVKLKQYKTISIFDYYVKYPFLYGINVVCPLNYMHYDKNEATNYLEKEVGYKRYDRKHGESIFTRFFQNYYLPKKFGIDKRKMHYSSLVLSGQFSRKQAIQELLKPLYEPAELAADLSFVARKLGMTTDELEALISAPGVHYSQYPNWDGKYGLLKKIQTISQVVLKRRVSNRG